MTINFEALPLPAFINAVYGDILKTSFEIDSAVQGRKDLVTLRAAAPMPPKQVDDLAREVLQSYGVAVSRKGDMLRFFIGNPKDSGEPPLLVSGRTLPEVPITHRPVFQLVPLTAVRNSQVRNWLQQAYKGQTLEIFEDTERNAILLMGPPEIVRQALEAVRILDQPSLRGSNSLRIEPVFLTATEMAGLLEQVLSAEGYAAGARGAPGSAMVLPISAVNAVLVFAADDVLLAHIRQWATTLDKPGQASAGGGPAIFYYQVQNTRAKELGAVLTSVLTGGANDTASPAAAPQTARPGAAVPTPAGGQSLPTNGTRNASGSPSATSRLVVDEARNGLIFQGDTAEWERLLPLVHQMDRPVRMVLIEVTVAEVTLTESEEFGIEWLFDDIHVGNINGALGTLGGLGIGSQGFTFTLDNAGQTLATLNAFSSRDRVKILSTPRIMVKSGGKAAIDVGTEVPIITSQSTSSDLQQDGTSAILQQIQYRKTGVLLDVSPVIHSGNRIDLEITQEVSESQPASSGEVQSPSIFTRKIDTNLSLQDGGSILLGGLITSNTSGGYSGVPGLKDIPLLGTLFKAQRKSKTRTELVMLIIPYVIDNHEDALAITKSFKDRFGTPQ